MLKRIYQSYIYRNKGIIMIKKILFILLGLVLSIFNIGSNVLLVNAVVYNSDKILLYTLLSLLFNFLFSVCYTDIFVVKTYENIFIKSLTKFMHSNSFNEISKGEYLQKIMDYPQNFMFIYSTILELISSIITLSIIYFLLPKNIKIIVLSLLPVILITILIFLYFRKNEEKLFDEQNDKNQEASDFFLNYINGLDNLRGIGKENFICEQVFEKKQDATQANLHFSFNQHIQRSIFSYSSFIPIIILLLINYIYPEFFSDCNIIGCIIAVRLILSLLYGFISEIIETKLYLLYKNDFKKWINSLKESHLPIRSCHNILLKINPSFNIFMDDFEINEGDFIQLHGPSGSGKSCFIDFLMGLRDSSNGISHFSDEKISYVGQKSYIFQGTFRDNMLKKLTNEDYELIKKIWFDNNLSEDFLKIEKMDTIKNKISSGQEILVTYCRALVNNTNYLILDEFDKNLSDDIVAYLLEFSKKNFKKIIVVSHENSNIKFANKHINMGDN